MSVDFPQPVSPNRRKFFWFLCLCRCIISWKLTNTQDVKIEPFVDTFVHQLIWKAVKAHMSRKFQISAVITLQKPAQNSASLFLSDSLQRKLYKTTNRSWYTVPATRQLVRAEGSTIQSLSY